MDIQETIKWRGSTHQMEKVEDGAVFWYNPVSRHHDHCDVESWQRGDPYGGRLS